MAKQKPKVLMLGWEFPPYMTGGLGVACQGIVNSLSPYVNISLFVPKSPANLPKYPFTLTGMNHAVNPETAVEETPFDKQSIDVILQPYQNDFELDNPDKQSFVQELPALTHFAKTDLYEGDLFSKVKDFARYSLALIADKPFDLIHAHDWMTFPAAIAIRNRTHKPLVLHIHSTEYDRKGKDSKGWVYQLEKTAMMEADCIITVSHYTSRILREHYDIPANKIIPVHNASEIKVVNREEKQFSEKLVTFTGRVTAQKNPKGFLDIACKVLEEYDNVRFVIAGNGDELPWLIQEVANKELSHKFHFMGFTEHSQIEKLLSVTDVFVMPSVSDPFGIAALEAARYGIPVLLSRTCGVLEVLKGAFTADYRDTTLFAEYLVTLLNAPELARSTGDKISASAENQTWSRAADAILEVYQMLLEAEEKHNISIIHTEDFL
ncbi:MAG: glycosyltransferase [Bacteroidia bacterium]|nr:glycosyltransferase [Bacteroidia bacterium]